MTTGKSLQAIGFWSSFTEAGLPDPARLVGPLEVEAERGQLVAYLRAGTVVETWRGWSDCRFDCGASGQEMGHSDLSDGEWIWPEGLAHYVERHGVALPREFVDHARRHSFQCPRANVTRSYSADFWVAWSRQHARGEGA